MYIGAVSSCVTTLGGALVLACVSLLCLVCVVSSAASVIIFVNMFDILINVWRSLSLM